MRNGNHKASGGGRRRRRRRRKRKRRRRRKRRRFRHPEAGRRDPKGGFRKDLGLHNIANHPAVVPLCLLIFQPPAQLFGDFPANL